MRMSSQRIVAVAALVLAWAAGACTSSATGGDEPKPCTGPADCPSATVCRDALCVAIPCGGRCADDEVCLNERCKPADGLDCDADPAVCPKGFTCSSTRTCARRCTTDDECPNPDAPSCNADIGLCGECTFNADCTADGKRFCDAQTATCVGCVDAASCYGANATPQGKYCDTATRECKDGCHGSTECPTGQRCLGGSATVIGKCVECLPATEPSDCLDPTRPRCDPQTNRCVACLADGDCPTAQCNVIKRQCVECVKNEVCQKGMVCDQDANLCVAGCAGGNGDANCPQTSPACDATFGDHGRCVECLVDADCPRAKVCDRSGAVPACVPGCTTSGGGDPNARCIDTSGGPQPADAKCDPTRGTRGQCVECLAGDSSSCPSGKACDATTAKCRCKTLGEPCTSVDECGYVPQTGQCVAYTATAGRTCISKVECRSGDQTATFIPGGSVCTLAPTGGTSCPAGFVAKYATDLRNNRRLECVPTGACP